MVREICKLRLVAREWKCLMHLSHSWAFKNWSHCGKWLYGELPRLTSLFYLVSLSSLFLSPPPSFLLSVSNEQRKWENTWLESEDVETVSQENQMLWQKRQLTLFPQDATFTSSPSPSPAWSIPPPLSSNEIIRCLMQSALNTFHVLFHRILPTI